MAPMRDESPPRLKAFRNSIPTPPGQSVPSPGQPAPPPVVSQPHDELSQAQPELSRAQPEPSQEPPQRAPAMEPSTDLRDGEAADNSSDLLASELNPTDCVETPVGAAPVEASNRHPLLQSLTLLLSMVIMLAVARFSVPSIVEEIRYAWHRGELRAEYETGSDGLKNVSLDSINRAYQMVTSAVGPSVVHIDVTRKATEQEKEVHRMLNSDLFSLSDQGSGVVVGAEGFILTNRHVIIDGESISVTLSDGRRRPAMVVGTDPLTDLAVLKIEATQLLPITWGDSDALRVGSPVWAVGSPFGLDRTVTFGILSGKHRMVRAGERNGSSGRYQDFMQSDVAVNPGNSGGPLVDARGTLVGINTAIVGDTYQGVSFSIPSNLSKQIYERILETGFVQRGYLGVSLEEVPDEMLIGDNTRVRGALVLGVARSESPAGNAGVQSGDIIRRANGEEVSDVGHLMRIVGNAHAGAVVDLGIRRDGEELELTVTLGNRPVTLDR
ncbi:S1C family serine protease [Neorhodopirellula lusitana]